MSDISPKERAARDFRIIEESLRDIFRVIDEGGKTDEDDDPEVALDHYPMQVELERSVRIVLSSGGPHIEAVAIIDGDGDVEDVVLKGFVDNQYFATFVDKQSAVHRAARRYVESVIL